RSRARTGQKPSAIAGRNSEIQPRGNSGVKMRLEQSHDRPGQQHRQSRSFRSVIMPFFGAHLSSAGGVQNAVRLAEQYGCDTLQLFTKAPSQWVAKPIADEEALQFRKRVRKAGIRFPIVHDCYLINLASPEEKLWQKSVDAFLDEVRRAEQIGASYLVTHPGAHLEAGEDAGIALVVKALNEVHEK